MLEVWMIVDGYPLQTFESFPLGTIGAGWYDLSFVQNGGAFDAMVTSEDGTVHEALHLDHRQTLSSASALQLSFSQCTGCSGAYVGAASMTRGEYGACGIEVPPSAAPAGVSRHVIAVAGHDSVVCVLGSMGQQMVRSFRSDDGGVSYPVAMPVALPTSAGASQNPCASLAWNAAEASFEGIVWTFSGTVVGSATLVSSADCHDWATTDAPPLAIDSLTCGSYSIVPESPSPTREIWNVARRDAAATATLVRAFAAGPFSPDAAPSMDTLVVPSFPPLGAGGMRDQITAFAGDLVVSAYDDRLNVFVVDRGLPHARDWLDLGPSHYEGSCDASIVQEATFYAATPRSGGIAYTCPGSDYFGGGPTVVQTIDVAWPM
jgi:hypothetical protein